MNTNSETSKNSSDIRIIITVLWVAEVLSSLNGDAYRLSDPVMLKSMVANTGPIVTTPGLLLVMSLIFVVPVLMSVLTLVLKSSASRGVNRIIGIIYVVITLAFVVLGFVLRSARYEFVWSTAQFVFTSLIVWYAWKWPRTVSMKN